MNIGIVGLGLIGGSMAKAYRAHANECEEPVGIYGYDLNSTILDFAILDGTLDGILDDGKVSECDLIFVALYPVATVEYMEKVAPLIKKTALSSMAARSTLERPQVAL